MADYRKIFGLFIVFVLLVSVVSLKRYQLISESLQNLIDYFKGCEMSIGLGQVRNSKARQDHKIVSDLVIMGKMTVRKGRC